MALQIEKGQNSTSECKQKNIDENVIEKMVMAGSLHLDTYCSLNVSVKTYLIVCYSLPSRQTGSSFTNRFCGSPVVDRYILIHFLSAHSSYFLKKTANFWFLWFNFSLSLILILEWQQPSVQKVSLNSIEWRQIITFEIFICFFPQNPGEHEVIND